MRNLETVKKNGVFTQSTPFKYIILFILVFMASYFFAGCTQSAPLVNSPTPLLTFTAEPTFTPLGNALNSPSQQITASSNATPIYDETYPIPEIIGNTGANIQNGGLSVSDRNKIYYINNGIVSMYKDGTNQRQITDMQNISCLNDVGEYIYFLSSHDGSIYRVEKQENSVPESLNISGASSMVVIGDFMYYCSSIGENATQYIYKSPLHGIIQECLFIKATSITPDGAYFYYDNLEDENTLWRYDTITSQTVKISNDKPSQLNIINDKIYYISENLDYNVVSVDRKGLNQVTVVTQGCTDLNIINNYLIYRTIDTGYIQSYNIKTGETVTLVSYGEMFALSTSDNMIFFQSCPIDGMEPETYFFNIATSKLNKSLPQKIYAFIRNIDIENNIFYYDRVDFYEGEKAIKQYSAINGLTLEDAEEQLSSDDGIFYVYNKQPAWLITTTHDSISVTLLRHNSSAGDNTPYTASLVELETLFETNPDLEGKLLFQLTILDKKVIDMNEVYYPINTDN